MDRYSLIETAREKYEQQKEKVAHDAYIEDLMFENFVREVTCLSESSKYDYFVDLFKKARPQIELKNKKDREDYELLSSILLEDFFDNNKNFKLVEIITGGYDACYYRFEFQYYDATCFVQIPIYKNIDKSNIGFANYGKFCFGVYKAPYCSDVLKTSYQVSEIADYIKGYCKMTEVLDDVKKIKLQGILDFTRSEE